MDVETNDEPDQKEVIAFLCQGKNFGLPDQQVERIDTHAAIIFLVGYRAYKLKRAVRYSFLDFSTLEKRHAVLEAEYRLNTRTAPGLYRRLVAVTRNTAGQLAVDGEGQPIEWLLEMRRFDQEDLFDHLAEQGKLDGPLMVSLANVVADLHRTAEVRSGGGYEAMALIVDGNASDLAALSDDIDRAGDIARLNDATREALSRRRDLLNQRADLGFVRRCHGDLHLGNIFLEDEHPVIFDCLEFDETLASIDVLYDLAFLLMDLCHRGLHELATDLFNAYLDQTCDDSGCTLLPLFLAIRATIRAKIEGFEIETASSADERRRHGIAARQYLDLAMDLLTADPPSLIAIGGLSGSGKSTVARLLAGRLGTRHWAVVLRSDLIRKKLHGVLPMERLGADAYGLAQSDEVYHVLERRAGDLLSAGRTVIADATFLDPADRSRIENIARDLDAPFHGIWLDASRRILKERITARRGDASDATTEVLAKQSARDTGTMTWTVTDASKEAEEVAEDVRNQLPISNRGKS